MRGASHPVTIVTKGAIAVSGTVPFLSSSWRDNSLTSARFQIDSGETSRSVSTGIAARPKRGSESHPLVQDDDHHRLVPRKKRATHNVVPDLASVCATINGKDVTNPGDQRNAN